MKDNQPKFIVIFFLAVDLMLMNIAYWAFADVQEEGQFVQIINTEIVFITCWFVVERALYIYDVRYLLNIEHILQTLFNACCVHLIVSIFVLYILQQNISRLFIFEFYSIFTALSFSFRMFARLGLRFINKNGYIYKRVAIIGANKEGYFLQKHINSENTFGIDFAGFITDDSEYHEHVEEFDTLGAIDNISIILEENDVNEIYWALPLSHEDQIRELIKLCDRKMIRFHTIPQFLAFPFKNLKVNYHAGIPIMHLREEPLESLVNRILKRAFDILFSLLVITLVLTWLIPLVAVITKMTSPGPIFFTQKRTGKDNRYFDMIKFRSMVVNNESDSKQAVKGDSRVTKFGEFLRRSSLDEMPQFINSLIGDMSVVGPRPHMINHTAEYSKVINQFMVRHYVKSGITGWAQVNGARGETETVEKMEKRVKLDIWYLEHWSLLLDIKICLRTIWNILLVREQSY